MKIKDAKHTLKYLIECGNRLNESTHISNYKKSKYKDFELKGQGNPETPKLFENGGVAIDYDDGKFVITNSQLGDHCYYSCPGLFFLNGEWVLESDWNCMSYDERFYHVAFGNIIQYEDQKKDDE